MSKRTIVLKDIWCDEGDEFWENEDEIEELIREMFEAINWEIGDIWILGKGNFVREC